MIINDDCFSYLSKIESNSIDLILVDFPFYGFNIGLKIELKIIYHMKYGKK